MGYLCQECDLIWLTFKFDWKLNGKWWIDWLEFGLPRTPRRNNGLLVKFEEGLTVWPWKMSLKCCLMNTWAQKQLTLLEVNHDGLLENPPFCSMISPAINFQVGWAFPAMSFMSCWVWKPPGFWEGPLPRACAAYAFPRLQRILHPANSKVAQQFLCTSFRRAKRSNMAMDNPHIYRLFAHYLHRGFPIAMFDDTGGSGVQGPAFQLWSFDILWLWT